MAVRPHGSEAYDLSLFEPKEDKIIELKPNKKLEKVQKRRVKLQSMLNTALTLFVAAILVTVIGSMITTRVQLTEQNKVISQKQQELEELKSEYKQLNAELAAKTSAQSVDAYAKENGMQKVESGQIQYITVDGGDKVELADDGAQSWWDKIGSAVTNFFAQLAYLFN